MKRTRTQLWCFYVSIFNAILFVYNCFPLNRYTNTPGHHALSQERSLSNPAFACVGHPTLLIVVLAYNRDASLHRLLRSLSLADYGCAKVDLQITVDIGEGKDPTILRGQERCMLVASMHNWEHGSKTVNRRLHHAGLSQSWFESTYDGNQEYVAFFEDDMEVSKHFYAVFRILAEHGAFSADGITGFCLHPNDWDVRVDRPCGSILYLSPEPCNWGPIWKRNSWRNYLNWVFSLKVSGMLPYVSEEVSFEYNSFLNEGKDVQSSWVWRYNLESRTQQVRYSFAQCKPRGRELHLAINHKEPGEHFSEKMNVQNSPDLLVFDIHKLLRALFKSINPFEPVPFVGYDSLTPLGANALGRSSA